MGTAGTVVLIVVVLLVLVVALWSVATRAALVRMRDLAVEAGALAEQRRSRLADLSAHLAAQEAAEAPADPQGGADGGYDPHTAAQTHEGEGALLTLGDLILAGTGFRTSRGSHAEAQELFGLPVISLELVDPHYYHLDTALAVLSSDPANPQVAYYPPAFSPGSRKVLERLYPDAVLATERDAVALGLNAVSDGHHVVVAPGAVDLAQALRDRGYEPIAVDTSELLKGGGGAKCCTLEIRGSVA